MNEYQVVAIAGAGLALLAGIWDAWRIRRRRRYSTPALLVEAAGPIAALGLYLAFTGLVLKPAATGGLAGVGALLGLLAGVVPRLSRDAGGIRLARAAWLPLPAALAVAAVQICAAVESLAGMIVAVAALEAAAGFGAGVVLALMLRRAFVRGGGAAGAGEAAADAAEAAPEPAQP